MGKIKVIGMIEKYQLQILKRWVKDFEVHKNSNFSSWVECEIQELELNDGTYFNNYIFTSTNNTNLYNCELEPYQVVLGFEKEVKEMINEL